MMRYDVFFFFEGVLLFLFPFGVISYHTTLHYTSEESAEEEEQAGEEKKKTTPAPPIPNHSIPSLTSRLTSILHSTRKRSQP